jgi:outer membrane protein assembly factor BamB
VSGLQVVWERDLHHAPSAWSIITPTVIVVPERRTKLCRVSPVDGSALWEADVLHPWGWLVASGSTCVYLDNRSLQCLELEDGAPRWEVDLAGSHGEIFGFLALVGDRVIVGGWRGYSDLIALAADTGAIVWAQPMQGEGLVAPVVGRDETLLLPFPAQGRATLVAAATGEKLGEWSCPRPDLFPDTSPIIIRHGDRFVCLGSEGRILQLDPTSDSDWVERARHPYPTRSFAPAITGSLLLFEDQRGLLCAYSLTSMSQRWETPVQHGRPDLLPAVQLDSGALAFAAASGQLSVLDDEGRAVARFGFRKRFLSEISLTPAGAIVAANGGRLIAFAATNLCR